MPEQPKDNQAKLEAIKAKLKDEEIKKAIAEKQEKIKHPVKK
jgi:hypothetical protein